LKESGSSVMLITEQTLLVSEGRAVSAVGELAAELISTWERLLSQLNRGCWSLYQRRIVVAGTGSGVGKTTLTLALMAAYRKRGLRVQGFKCGPDYIDPTYHTEVTGRASRNLDSWMTDEAAVREIFAKGAEDADLSIIEGVMGFFDGKNPTDNTGSTAEISRIVESPVVLVVDCHSMARSAAAVVKGFQWFDPGVTIAAVLANGVGSEHHYRLIQTAVEQECGIPTAGYMLRESGIEIPERHLGLVPSIGRGEMDGLFGALAAAAERTIDLQLLLELSEVQPIAVERKLFAARTVKSESEGAEPVKIAVAKDAAFHFYYPENLELLEAAGAECVYFSPLAGDRVPEDADGLYIGGGFPEEFARALAADEDVKASVRSFAASGKPVVAECGGYMYLTEAIVTTAGVTYPMVGAVPGQVRMQKKLAALGYREVTGKEGNFLLGPGDKARGHEFHYSVYENEDTAEPAAHAAYRSEGMMGVKDEGWAAGSVMAGYTHLHLASSPGLAERWVAHCRRVRACVPRRET
jgi:cobyrinic acid a,c-diamide synthase